MFVDRPCSRAIEAAVSDPHLTSRLLAGRNRLGRIEKDEIFAHVVRDRAAPRVRWPWLALPVIAAAAVLIVVLGSRSGTPDPLAARGGDVPVAQLVPTCGAAPCARGGKLLLDLHGTTGYRYFAAFARRDDDGTVIWYVPSAPDGTARALEGAVRDGVFADAIVVGDEHRPGRYRVYGVFAQAPLAREAIRALFDADGHVRATPGAAVVDRELVIR
jgi:hypothetical protein